MTADKDNERTTPQICRIGGVSDEKNALKRQSVAKQIQHTNQHPMVHTYLIED